MLLLSIPLALADVAPPPDYVETCTIDLQCGPDIEGRICQGDMRDDDADCQDDIDAGWVKMCKAWGGTMYDVVLCKEQPDEAAVAARVEGASSSWLCATANLSVGWSALGIALLLGLRRR